MDQPWGKKAVRIGIGIGEDTDYHMLQRFIDNPEIKPLQAPNVEQLVNYIKWTYSVGLGLGHIVLDVPSRGFPGLNIPAPLPSPSDGNQSSGDIF